MERKELVFASLRLRVFALLGILKEPLSPGTWSTCRMHVAITGASSGIGEALVREYVRAGASVTLVARRKEKLDEIAREVGGKTHVAAADLSKPEQALAWLEPSQQALGPI